MVSDNTIRNPVCVTDKYRHIQNCSPMSCYQALVVETLKLKSWYRNTK